MWEQPGVQCYPAINLRLKRKRLKWGQRTVKAPSKEESSLKKKQQKQTTKQIIAVLFNLFLSISCFLCSLHCITFPSHTDVTLQVPLGSCPNVSRVCEKCPFVTKLMTCKKDKLKHSNRGYKKMQIFSSSLPEKVHPTTFVLLGGLSWSVFIYQTLLESPKCCVIRKASKGLIQSLWETSSFSPMFTEIND